MTELDPITRADVVQSAYPELHIENHTRNGRSTPRRKSTVPVAPIGTSATNVIAVPTFCGEAGNAPNVVEEDDGDGVVVTVYDLVGPSPPELDAKTLKVTDVPGEY